MAFGFPLEHKVGRLLAIFPRLVLDHLRIRDCERQYRGLGRAAMPEGRMSPEAGLSLESWVGGEIHCSTETIRQWTRTHWFRLR